MDILFKLLLASTIHLILAQDNSTATSSPTITIRKCKCGVDEVFTNNTCIPSQNMFLPFWDEKSQNLKKVDVSNLNLNFESPFKCPPDKIENMVTSFLMLNDGKIDDLSWDDDPVYSNYCIEYASVEGNNIPYGITCTEIPKLPMCCDSNEEGNCPNKPSSPPPMYRNPGWQGYTIVDVYLTCPKGFISTIQPLSMPSVFGASLVGYPPGKRLMWFTEYMSQPSHREISEYCLMIDEEGAYNARFCIPDPKLQHEVQCKGKSCLRKCCPEGLMYDTYYSFCVPGNQTIRFGSHSENAGDNLTIVYGMPLCEEFGPATPKLVNGSSSMVYVQDGKATIDGYVQEDSKMFCLDYFVEDFTKEDSNPEVAAISCIIAFNDKCQWRFVMTSILLAISCLFYLATLLVYAIIPDLHRKIPGKCLISEVSALFITYVFLIYLMNNRNYTTIACNLPGTIEHVAALASFFWLNVLCYDMWKTLKTVRVAEVDQRSNKKFIRYCLYGWGVPLVIGLLRILIDSLPESEDGSNWLIRSNLGKTHCFFTSKYAAAKWLYLYLPVMMILVVNTCFFLHVVVILHRAQKESKRNLQGSGSSTTGRNFNAKKEKVRLYMKLFLAMGLPWMLEIIMWISVSENDCYFWALDIINMFQGVYIFIIFVCKKSTIKKIKEYWGLNKTKPDAIDLDLHR